MKKAIALISLTAILVAGCFAMKYSYEYVPITYDGSYTPVLDLYEDPHGYDLSGADGVASIIVKTNLEQTMAANNVAAVVFDYRGFDTIGESFILLAAIAGSNAILRSGKKKGKEEHEDEV